MVNKIQWKSMVHLRWNQGGICQGKAQVIVVYGKEIASQRRHTGRISKVKKFVCCYPSCLSKSLYAENQTNSTDT